MVLLLILIVSFFLFFAFSFASFFLTHTQTKQKFVKIPRSNMFDFLFGKNKDKESRSSSSGKGGGGGGQPKTSAAMQNLDDAIDLVERKENMLQKKIDAELAKAKELYGKKNTNGAMQCMKRKKVYEEQLGRLGAQKANLETQRFALDNQQMNMELLAAQKKAAEELKKANKKMDAGKIEDQMDEIMDEMDKANQVSEALANPIDNNNVVDEDDLMNELEMELANDNEQEEQDLAELLGKTKVPQNKVSGGKTKTDADILAELEAELAG